MARSRRHRRHYFDVGALPIAPRRILSRLKYVATVRPKSVRRTHPKSHMIVGVKRKLRPLPVVMPFVPFRVDPSRVVRTKKLLTCRQQAQRPTEKKQFSSGGGSPRQWAIARKRREERCIGG